MPRGSHGLLSQSLKSVATSGNCPVLGLVGGVGSGKSSLARRLAKRFGAALIDGDAAGHRALSDPFILEQLRRHFGDQILNPDKSINRSALAQRVFGPTSEHEQARRALEQWTHPRIRAEIETTIEQARSAGLPFVLLDAAILLETGWRELCDYIVFVEAIEENRQARAVARGWTPEQWRQREAAQLSLQEKRLSADAVVDNNGTLDEAVNELKPLLTLIGVDLEGQSMVTSP